MIEAVLLGMLAGLLVVAAVLAFKELGDKLMVPAAVILSAGAAIIAGRNVEREIRRQAAIDAAMEAANE